MVATTPSFNGDGGQANLHLIQGSYTTDLQESVVASLSQQIQGNAVLNDVGGNGDRKFRLFSLLSLRVSGRCKGCGGQSCRRDGAAQTEGGQTLLAPRRSSSLRGKHGHLFS